MRCLKKKVRNHEIDLLSTSGKKNNQTHTHIQTNKTSNNKPLQKKALTMTELSDPTSLKTDEHFDQSTVQNEMRSHAKKKWGIL